MSRSNSSFHATSAAVPTPSEASTPEAPRPAVMSSQPAAAATVITKKPSSASVAKAGMYAPPPAKAASAVDQKDVDKLAQHIAYGEQDDAKEMIKKNPDLLRHKGKAKDYSGREFNLEPLALAWWGWDSHMADMIKPYLKYLPDDEAAKQLAELDGKGTAHGTHYDFDDLLKPYKIFCDNFDALCKQNDAQQLDKLWLNIRKAEARVPAGVAHVVCQNGIPLHPIRDFKNYALPPPVRKLDLAQGIRLPKILTHAGREVLIAGHVHWGDSQAVSLTAAASAALTELCKTRNKQYEDFIAALPLPHAGLALRS